MRIDSVKLKKMLSSHTHEPIDEYDGVTRCFNLGIETAIKIVILLEQFTKED